MSEMKETQLIKKCADMRHSYRWPYEPWISACEKHMKECNDCQKKFMPYFNGIEKDLHDGKKALNASIESFKILADQCGQGGKPNAAGVLVGNAAIQILNDCGEYLDKLPNDNGGALVWLQKVFAVCRFYEAETRCQKGIPAKERKLKVGDMTDDKSQKFKTITSLSYLLKNHSHNTFKFNFELQKQINDLLNAKEYYRALRLICDSPKHGVLSSILNFKSIIWAKQIYSIGLHALSHVINTFVKEYRAENSLPELKKAK